MRYSVFAGGKRLRPILDAGGGGRRRASDDGSPRDGRGARCALPAACAIELIHTYSLIHDDLPAMDNDTLRRGRPTLHVVYGDGIAILAGDGLQAEAFALLAREPADRTRRGRRAQAAASSRVIADAAGAAGMVGGQAIDLQAAGQATGHALTLDAERLRGHARAEDRRADPRVGRQRRDHGRRHDDADRRGRSLRRSSSVWRFRSSTTSSTSKASADARQDRRQGRGRRQADLSRALRPRAVARAGGRLHRARAAHRSPSAGLTDGWLGPIADWVRQPPLR